MDINFLKNNQRNLSSKKREIIHKEANLEKIFFDKIITNLYWFKKRKIIASFMSIKSEISTTSLNLFILQSKKLLCLPVISKDEDGVLIFKEYSTGDILVKGKYGVREPVNTNIFIPDIIFAPCLAFDKNGFRLGYGGGYYDKTISYLKSIKHDFITVGLAYDDQKVDNVVRDHLDLKLNYILTEKQLYKIL